MRSEMIEEEFIRVDGFALGMTLDGVVPADREA
jgi:hypothetical protein